MIVLCSQHLSRFPKPFQCSDNKLASSPLIFVATGL
jgi:hypothetical protein